MVLKSSGCFWGFVLLNLDFVQLKTRSFVSKNPSGFEDVFVHLNNPFSLLKEGILFIFISQHRISCDCDYPVKSDADFTFLE